MTTVVEALEAWFTVMAEAGCPRELEAVLVPVAEAAGRVTSQSVWALRSSPPFEAAAMDGIAVRAARSSGASALDPVALAAGDYVVVDTGDPLPDGFDAVVMREHVEFSEGRAELHAEVEPYENVRSIGEDVVANELLLPEGHRLRPVDIAACAAAGVTELVVRRKPVVAVLPTGDEIRPVGTRLEAGEFYDTNSIMLAAQARELGCESVVLPIEPDNPDGIARAVLEAASRSDLVVVIAGASAGRDDYTATVLGRLGVVAVRGVKMRPGHPVMLGAVDSTPVLGAPGYPVSAALSFDVFAAPLLARLEGTVGRHRPSLVASLARAVPSAEDRDEWVRVRLGRVHGRLLAEPLERGAGVLTSLVRADGLVVIPVGSHGFGAGDKVEVSLLVDPAELESTIVLAGPGDPALGILAGALRSGEAKRSLALRETGPAAGLVALSKGLCHVAAWAPLRSRGSEAGELEGVVADLALGAVRLGRRQLGLLVAPGNPLGLESIADIARLKARYANRRQGTSTRALFDGELDLLGVGKLSIRGYEREERSHLAVAAAVASGRCDCGLAVFAAARAFGLGFVPVTDQPYDLVVDSQMFEDALLEPLWLLVSSSRFRLRLEALGGYDTTETGKRVL